MSLEGRQIGFIGAGAMAEALVGGLVAAGTPADCIRAADPDPARRVRVAERFGIATTPDNAEVVRASDVVVLAVKPGDGVPIRRLEAGLSVEARIVRAMPNTPALVRAAATGFCGNARAAASDRDAARALFDSVGSSWEAPSEGLLDAVTGLSGSGPAYVFVFLEALGDAGVRMGLPREAAFDLALHTVFGAARLALETGRHPTQLKDQVTSPGGTTIAGLERLEAEGLRTAVYEAVAAATQRSRELGQA
jgi:pyrroline-5-carboxylate reductase